MKAYKERITQTYNALVEQAGIPSQEDDLSEEEWIGDWKDFWGKKK